MIQILLKYVDLNFFFDIAIYIAMQEFSLLNVCAIFIEHFS